MSAGIDRNIEPYQERQESILECDWSIRQETPGVKSLESLGEPSEPPQ